MRAHRRFAAPAALIGLVLIAPLALAACTHDGEKPDAASDRYGSLPAYLPKSSVQPDGVLTGTAARPALTTEGDTVRVKVAGGSVLATVTGPEVPGEGLPYQADATTCTWTVTLSGATTDIPIRTLAFTSIDHLGAVYHSAFVPGQPKAPDVLKPGQKTTFELRAVMTVGEGLMRWAPDGKHILSSWDFEVEND